MCSQHNDALAAKRHSLAHLLAAAVLDLYPGSHNAIGPAVENGFYQDFEMSETLSDKDLKKIEKRMRQILKSWTTFQETELTPEEARKVFVHNPYKLALIDDIIERDEKILKQVSGNFIDLCRGGHINDMSQIDPDSFKLDRLAGAYWKNDENNLMLTRIYGLAFDTKEELDAYLNLREEAKKRDHKKIGQELGLFAFSERVGRGLPLFLPKGTIIREQLENFVRKEKEKLGYKFVSIPHIAKRELYETSGHMGKYDAMMPTMTDQNGDEYVMKAMNCPHHFEIYNAQNHSYRDLPLRIAENTTVYRNEKSGELSGLLRVKSLMQDDTHHFVREDQIGDEIDMILDLMRRVYDIFNFSDYKVEISVRDPRKKEAYFGDDALWDKAENLLIEYTKKNNFEYTVEEGEAAFYGPKIDVRVKDAIGRDWQLTTVQLDFNQPENFEMDYTGHDGQKHRVVVLHVAILGSIERFLGVLIEHYAGHFPLWLAPVQVAVLPISSDNHGDYTANIVKQLQATGIRAEHHDDNESLGKRIRTAKMQKIPYLIIVGDSEVAGNVITVEGRDDLKLENISLEEFVQRINNEVDGK